MYYDLTISSGGSLSAAQEFQKTVNAQNGEALIRLDMPSGWDAAGITFQVSEDGQTYRNLYDAAGNEKALTVAASRAIYLPPLDFAGIRFIKVRSGTAGSPVNQTADRTIRLVTRAMF